MLECSSSSSRAVAHRFDLEKRSEREGEGRERRTCLCTVDPKSSTARRLGSAAIVDMKTVPVARGRCLVYGSLRGVYVGKGKRAKGRKNRT